MTATPEIPPAAGSRLSAEQLSAYQQQGFVVLRGFFEPAELEPWTERLAAIAAEMERLDAGSDNAVDSEIGVDGLEALAGVRR